jgi:hypothetical protein
VDPVASERETFDSDAMVVSFSSERRERAIVRGDYEGILPVVKARRDGSSGVDVPECEAIADR